MDHVLSYNFDEIEYTVRQDIHATSARLNAALDDLRAQIAPLQQVWTREAAEAYRVEQARWEQAVTALNEILFSLGNAVRDGAEDVAATDRTAANAWGVLTPHGQDPVRSRLEGSQRDCTVLSALARNAVAIAIEFRKVIRRVLSDVADAVCLGLAAIVVWARRAGNWSEPSCDSGGKESGRRKNAKHLHSIVILKYWRLTGRCARSVHSEGTAIPSQGIRCFPTFANAEVCTRVVIGRQRQPSRRTRHAEAKSPCLTPARLGYCGGHARQPAQIGLRARSVIASGNLEDLGRPGIGPAVALDAAHRT